MKKIIKRIFQIAGIALAAYILCQIFYYRIYLNIPSAAAKGLQKRITEEMGEGFKLTNPTHENTEISYITVDIDSELYMDEKIFSDCSRLKDIIYDYAREHPDNFSLIPASDQDIDEHTFCAKGIHVNFTGGKLYRENRIVFEFTNYLDTENRYDNRLSHMRVSGRGMEHYGYRLSDFVKFDGIKELYCDDEIEIDNPEALGEMKELNLFDWEGDPEIEEKLMKAADKYGIWFQYSSFLQYKYR
ncbi:MAG: hypothetical protein HFG34_02505 [Eubacterium sp.]|nr:hypothetical protein [Eubacterium sp.]